MERTRKLQSYLADRKRYESRNTIDVIRNYALTRNGDNLKLVMLWGASNKKEANKADKDALLYLFHFINELETTYEQKCQLTIIFTDTHVYLNGYDLDSMYQYFLEIKYHLKKQHFLYTYSSSICKDAFQSSEYDNWKCFIDSIIKKPIEHFKQTELHSESVERFISYANRHCNRIKQSFNSNQLLFNDSNEASKAYLYLSSIEKKVIEAKYSDSIFITYMNKEEDFILPNLPIVRLYSIKSGLRTRPWFTT